MADEVFNISLGRVIELVNRVKGNDPTNAVFTVALLKLAEADATLGNHDEMNALLTATGNTLATFTNYVESGSTFNPYVDDSEMTGFNVTVDDGNDWVDADFPDVTWTAAGNGANDNLVKLIIAYKADSTSGTAIDSSVVPCTHHDFVVTTDGSDLTAQIAAAGFFRATG